MHFIRSYLFKYHRASFFWRVFLVDPVNGITPDGENYDEPRFIRAEMQRCASSIKATFISLENVDWYEDDMMEDGIHYPVIYW